MLAVSTLETGRAMRSVFYARRGAAATAFFPHCVLTLRGGLSFAPLRRAGHSPQIGLHALYTNPVRFAGLSRL